MSIDPLVVAGTIQDKNVRMTLDQWKEQLNALITSYNAGVTKNFNTSAVNAVVVQNGTITGVT